MLVALTLVAVSFLAVSLVVCFAWFQSRMYLRIISELTDKVKAPDLMTYKQATVSKPLTNSTIQHTSPRISLADANPEDVMKSISQQLGREEE